MQIVVAGKAHPADEGGKDLIRQFVEFASEPEVRHRIVFLPNYDMAWRATSSPGADVWLNNPLRPYEACGTSGMKAALNGGLNLSILDGWWDELYDGRNGWAIPSADDGTLDPEKRDDFEGRAIFDLLENEVVPMFYERSDGLPRRWIGMVRHAGLDTRAGGRRRAHAARLRRAAVRPGRPRPDRPREQRGPAGLADWKERVRSGWSAVAVRNVETAPATVASASAWPCARPSRWAISRPTMSRWSRSAAASATTTGYRAARRRAWRPPAATAGRAPTCSRARSRWSRPARSATPCGWCRTTARWRRRPSSGWSSGRRRSLSVPRHSDR